MKQNLDRRWPTWFIKPTSKGIVFHDGSELGRLPSDVLGCHHTGASADERGS